MTQTKAALKNQQSKISVERGQNAKASGVPVLSATKLREQIYFGRSKPAPLLQGADAERKSIALVASLEPLSTWELHTSLQSDKNRVNFERFVNAFLEQRALSFYYKAEMAGHSLFPWHQMHILHQ